jgi:hypothetical protein
VSSLLDQAVDAHGGMERRKLIRVDVRLSVSSALFQIKGHPEGLYDVVVHTDLQRPSVTICSFGTEVAGGGIASHYCFDHASFSGLILPMDVARLVGRLQVHSFQVQLGSSY